MAAIARQLSHRVARFSYQLEAAGIARSGPGVCHMKNMALSSGLRKSPEGSETVSQSSARSRQAYQETFDRITCCNGVNMAHDGGMCV